MASTKQCGRTVVPEVAEPRTLDECLREFQAGLRYLLAEPALVPRRRGVPSALAATPSDAGVLLLVGPEGGWMPEEAAAAAAAGCLPLTLGPRTLRADAAAVVGLTALRCFWGEFSHGPHSDEDFELGRPEALVAGYPRHRGIIERLTRA